MGSNDAEKAEAVLQWMQLGMIVIPQIINVVTHYKSLSESEELSETDKEKMKANLQALKLPEWDNI